ncbi:MAG: DUF2628 domain-containing protein [Clostridiales bacterium]|nr:DUF2628 domain-containing protein [Clostridiales bacterium]MDD7036108.1 DUF2628 domain-containing protein [Bacillota bacterium]MDY2920165.1 DUF2628 domain-containing protein [Lentihominibacter sp.]
MNYCPKCGAPTHNMNFCTKCGFELRKTPAREECDTGSQICHDDTRSMRAAIVKENHEYYLPIFESIDRNEGSRWSWCGFLFAPLWLAYRKLYLWSAVAIAAPMLLLLFMEFSMGSSVSDGNGIFIFVRVFVFLTAVLFGKMSNMLYKKYVDKLISAMPEDTGEAKLYIDRKGGTSGLSLVLAGAACGAAIALLVFVYTCVE